MNKMLTYGLLLMNVVFSSCNIILEKCYGIKHPESKHDNDILKKTERYKRPNVYFFRLDNSFKQYYISFRDSSVDNTSSCSNNTQLSYDLSQPIQAFYFDPSGNVVAYYTNCYAGGFPNLKWNKDNNFLNFPPKGIVSPLPSRVELKDLVAYCIPLNKESQILLKEMNFNHHYSIVVFWNHFMWRQSKRLLNNIINNTKDKACSILLVNNDNFYVGEFR